ncbi:MAG: DEAD/DEAH box helicase [Acidimicrobiia bacterium]|nr:DEAD/DEAH box helicase [Acidimicrobiia bacterium]
MARSVRLRPWQKRALEIFRAHERPDFLAVATPGAGKTTFALTAAALELAEDPARRLVVVTPTRHLKTQWAAAADGLGLVLEPAWNPANGRLPADAHGVVVTYQQVATQTRHLRALADGGIVVLDEVHHAGDDRSWGDGIREAFDTSARRLSLSGTPFRSDDTPIPFVTYHLDEARPDIEYGYGHALADGHVVRPVWFPRVDGHMEWVAPDGEHYSHTFEDALDRTRSNQRLRAALSLHGDWLATVVDRAHEQLTAIRARHPDAGGLVIASDHQHARGIVALLRRRHGVHASLVLSDDPAASSRIAHFARSDAPWLVAVRMVSEGVDIPRLRVGVYATTTTTELFFRQAVGRLVRWQQGVAGRQGAVLYIPDDPRLRTWAARIATERRHVLNRRSTGGVDDDELRDPLAAEEAALEPDDGQLSLFSVVSATAIERPDLARPEWLDDDSGEPGTGDETGAANAGADTDHDASAATSSDEPAPDPLLVTLPTPAGRAGGAERGGRTVDRAERERLRRVNGERAADLAQLTGLSHAQVHGELNRLAGVTRVSEATATQLERRLAEADRWLARIVGGRGSSSQRRRSAPRRSAYR